MKTQKIVLLAIIFAIMIVFLIFIPLNAIVPLIALMVLAETEDIKLAALGGLLFGLASFFAALFFPSSPLYVIFLNPMISIIPRILVGVLVYLIYQACFKLLTRKYKFDVKSKDIYFMLQGKDKKIAGYKDYISLTISSVCGALINTTLVLGTMFLLYSGNTYTLNQISILVKPAVIIPILLPSIISEPIVCGIVVPPIVTALKHIR